MYKKGGIGGLNTKGGPGDIFKVGKSNAKKFNKVFTLTNSVISRSCPS